MWFYTLCSYRYALWFAEGPLLDGKDPINHALCAECDGSWLRSLYASSGRIFCLYLGTRPIGFVIFHLQQDFVIVATCIVHPEFRRKGCCSVLMAILSFLCASNSRPHIVGQAQLSNTAPWSAVGGERLPDDAPLLQSFREHAVYVEDAHWNFCIDAKATTLKDNIVVLWQKLLQLKPNIFDPIVPLAPPAHLPSLHGSREQSVSASRYVAATEVSAVGAIFVGPTASPHSRVVKHLCEHNYWMTPSKSKDPPLCVADSTIGEHAGKGVFYVGHMTIPGNCKILGIYSGRDVGRHVPGQDTSYYHPTTRGHLLDGMRKVDDIPPLVQKVGCEVGHNVVASFVNHKPHGVASNVEMVFVEALEIRGKRLRAFHSHPVLDTTGVHGTLLGMLFLVSKRPIRPGDELFLKYADDSAKHFMKTDEMITDSEGEMDESDNDPSQKRPSIYHVGQQNNTPQESDGSDDESF